MRTFGTIKSKDYTVDKFYASSPMSWDLVSSSIGVHITNPSDLIGAVTITKAKNTTDLTLANIETGVSQSILYSSVKNMFYDDALFFNGGKLSTASLSGIPNDAYVVSIGQYFYGEQIKPGSFELAIDSDPQVVFDDGYGNLIVSQSGTGYYVGNIFYDYGIAVIAQNTSSLASSIDNYGIKIVGGTNVYVDYSSNVKITRHQVNVKIDPSSFNHSLLNPSLRTKMYLTGSATGSFVGSGLDESTTGYWSMYDLMAAGVIKPYVTTIGLYDDKYQLLAVAKLSTPIQRTFDMEQIFIVRFDT